MVNDKIKEINLFIDGVASVCNDINVIAEKTQNYFGKNFKRFVDYVLIMKYRTFSAEQFAKILCKRDLSEGLSGIEIECAKRSGLVIVSGYSDDVIELKGTIFAVGDCFDGGDFHLKREKGKWNLERTTIFLPCGMIKTRSRMMVNQFHGHIRPIFHMKVLSLLMTESHSVKDLSLIYTI
jgi:hypothetical protein